MKGWGHDGCAAYYSLRLTSCPRHPGAVLDLREVKAVPKNTRFSGPTNYGLNETSAGFTEPALSPPPDWVRDEAPASVPLETVPPVDAPFDPAEFTVADVIAELPSLSAPERHAVIEAERAGKARAGILNA